MKGWLDNYKMPDGGKVDFPTNRSLQSIFHIDNQAGTTRDTAGYLSALKLAKDNGNPNIILNSNSPKLDRYAKKGDRSQYIADNNEIVLEQQPNAFKYFINELAHSKQYKDGWNKQPHPVQDRLFKQYENLRLNTSEQEAQDWYHKNMYTTPGTQEYNAHIEVAPKLYDDYTKMRDSTLKNMPQFFKKEMVASKFGDGGKVDNTGHAPYIDKDKVDFKRKQQEFKQDNIPYKAHQAINNQVETEQNIDNTLKWLDRGINVAAMAYPALRANKIRQIATNEIIPEIVPIVEKEVPQMYKLPIYSQQPLKPLPEHLKATLIGKLEKDPPLSKEEEIWQNIKNIGKREMGGQISSRTNTKWLDKYNDTY